MRRRTRQAAMVPGGGVEAEGGGEGDAGVDAMRGLVWWGDRMVFWWGSKEGGGIFAVGVGRELKGREIAEARKGGDAEDGFLDRITGLTGLKSEFGGRLDGFGSVGAL